MARSSQAMTLVEHSTFGDLVTRRGDGGDDGDASDDASDDDGDGGDTNTAPPSTATGPPQSFPALLL